MPSGIKIKDLAVGTGTVAQRGKVAVAHIRGFLHSGEECYNTYKQGAPARIDLSKREAIAGLRQGLEGMRVGGRRELTVSPHLAYGEKGVPNRIPPNAVIRFEVELLAVREPNEVCPDECPPGKYLLVSRSGEAARNIVRWQFVTGEDGRSGAVLTYPLPNVTWRYARSKTIEIQLSSVEIAELIQSAQQTLADFPTSCLRHEDLWADASEKANSITRDNKNNSRCVVITLHEKGATLLYYALPESSPILTGSKFYQIISRELAPYLSDQDTSVSEDLS